MRRCQKGLGAEAVAPPGCVKRLGVGDQQFVVIEVAKGPLRLGRVLRRHRSPSSVDWLILVADRTWSKLPCVSVGATQGQSCYDRS